MMITGSITKQKSKSMYVLIRVCLIFSFVCRFILKGEKSLKNSFMTKVELSCEFVNCHHNLLFLFIVYKYNLAYFGCCKVTNIFY